MLLPIRIPSECEIKVAALINRKMDYADPPPFPPPTDGQDVLQTCSQDGCNKMPTPVPEDILDTCGFYRYRFDDFNERHTSCGHTTPDYYEHYGYKYCVKFRQVLRPLLSKKGQAWLDLARFLLQDYMEQGLHTQQFPGILRAKDGRSTPPRSGDTDITGNSPHSQPNGGGQVMIAVAADIELNNMAFRTFAFDTHPPAYLNAGITQLSMCDKTLIGLTPDTGEWFNLETWSQAVDVGWEQVKSWYDDVRNFFR